MSAPDPTAADTDGGNEEHDEDSTQEEALQELRTARIARLEDELERKTNEIEKLKETIEQLRDDTAGEGSVDVKDAIKASEETVDGTPNRDDEISERMEQEPPDDAEFEALADDEATLHKVIVEGPSPLTVAHNPVYPVHERARDVLLHAPTLGNVTEIDGCSHIRITLPEAKLFIESREDQSIKHTQMRRVFEQLANAGSDYPRPPILHKNSAGHIELVIFDYDALFSTR